MLKVIPKDVSSKSYSSHLFYNCTKITNLNNRTILIAGNGSHTEYIEKVLTKEDQIVDCASEILQVLGHEQDEQRTPRILGIVTEEQLILGLIGENGLGLKKFQPYPGKAFFVSTLQLQEVGEHIIKDFKAENALELIRLLKEMTPFNKFTNYLAAVAAVLFNGRFDLACD
ncbi:IMP cyclohydrolase [[Eubacterium] cellulosolvens]